MNDMTRIEGIRDTLNDQIYEYVFPYMREHNMFQDNDSFLERVRDFLRRVDDLPTLYINHQTDVLNNEINELYQELNELLTIAHYKNVH